MHLSVSRWSSTNEYESVPLCPASLWQMNYWLENLEIFASIEMNFTLNYNNKGRALMNAGLGQVPVHKWSSRSNKYIYLKLYWFCWKLEDWQKRKSSCVSMSLFPIIENMKSRLLIGLGKESLGASVERGRLQLEISLRSSRLVTDWLCRTEFT